MTADAIAAIGEAVVLTLAGLPGPRPSVAAVLDGTVVVDADGGRAAVAGPAAAGMLVALAAERLVAQGLLSPGTTVAECTPSRDLEPADAAATVGQLVDRLADPTADRVATIDLLGRVLAAAGGLGVDDVVVHTVTTPLALADTAPLSEVSLFGARPTDAGELGWDDADVVWPAVPPLAWRTTAVDLAQLADRALARPGAAPAAAAGTLRRHVVDRDGGGVWRWDPPGLTLAASGDAGPVVAAVDALLTRPVTRP